jgi:hypothetical protein
MAEFIHAIAPLLWPLLIAGIVVAYRYEIRDILKRLSEIRKGKLFGQEFELGEKLDQLEESTEKAEEEVAVVTPQEEPSDPAGTQTEKLEERLLRDARTAPKITLMLLSAEIDRRLRQLFAATGRRQKIRPAPIESAIEQLRAQGSLPEHVTGSLKLFQEVRNRIIHGRAATDDEIIRAIDSGFSLLKAIDAIPAEVNTVHRIGIPVYSDPACKNRIADATGLMLETTTPGGADKSFRIFPTTRTHFEVGRRVAWEWNRDRNWGPAWHSDPDSSECKQACRGSTEFVGRHLDDI